MDLTEPDIQALSCPTPHHLKKVLHELIGGIERGMCQTKSGQIFSLDRVQMLWTTHEEPNCGCRGVMRQASCPRRRHNLRSFERLQEAIDHALRSAIPLEPHFPPQLAATALTFLPAFKHVGGVRIKRAALFASWSGIGSHSFVEPIPHGARFHPKPTSYLLRRQSLLTQGEHLLIALLSLGPPRGNGLLHAFFLGRTPFLKRQEAGAFRLRRSFCSLAGRFPLEEATCEQLLDGFRQVLSHLEAVSYLNGLWSPTRHRTSANGRWSLPQWQLSYSYLVG